jgi:hypothetical protein
VQPSDLGSHQVSLLRSPFQVGNAALERIDVGGLAVSQAEGKQHGACSARDPATK